MTIICNHCGKPICDKGKHARPFRGLSYTKSKHAAGEILAFDKPEWVYYHDSCFINATVPPHNMRGGFLCNERQAIC